MITLIKLFSLLEREEEAVAKSNNDPFDFDKPDGMTDNIFNYLNSIFKDAKNDIFKSKCIRVNSEIKSFQYSPVLIFFDCPVTIDKLMEESITFKCEFCNKHVKSKINDSRNLFTHIDFHPPLKEWHRVYTAWNKRGKPLKSQSIDDNTMALITFFITSDIALEALKNSSLEYLLKKIGMKSPSYYSFRNNLLPSVMKKLIEAIEIKLKEAETICLITDIWSNRINVDYIALGANITSKNFEKETLILSMMPMQGKSN